MPFNFDEGKPGDSDIVSQFPANERAARAAMKAAYVAEHSINTGHHHLPAFVSQGARDAAVPGWEAGAFAAVQYAGAAGFQLQRYDGTGWQRFEEIPPGTLMLFIASTAPLGWTQFPGWNDRLIRIVSGAGQGVGGSWSIGGLTAETAHHFHSFSGVTGQPNDSRVAQGGSAFGLATNVHIHGFSGVTSEESAAHTHVGDGGWRPEYLDVISCSKNALV